MSDLSNPQENQEAQPMPDENREAVQPPSDDIGASEPAAPDAAQKASLSDKKKNALLRYMAILFGVAFLLVLLSFLIQMRDSRQTISKLNQSNASALQNAGKLQDENQALTTENKALTDQVDRLEAQLETAGKRDETNRSDLEAAKKELEQAAADLAAAQSENEALAKSAEAWLNGDVSASKAALAEVSPERLGESGRQLYELLTRLTKD